MSSDKLWKQCERRFARFFGSERVRGSGSGVGNRGNVEETTSDSHHQRIYGEVKSVSGPRSSNGYFYRWLKKMGWPRGLVVCAECLFVLHSSQVKPVPAWGGVPRAVSVPVQLFQLWTSVFEAAECECKVPLIGLFVKGRHGFWLVGTKSSLLAAIKEREGVIDGTV